MNSSGPLPIWFSMNITVCGGRVYIHRVSAQGPDLEVRRTLWDELSPQQKANFADQLERMWEFMRAPLRGPGEDLP